MIFKKMLLALSVLVATTSAWSLAIVYDQPLVSEEALTHDASYPLDLKQIGVSELSAQAVYSSATVSAQTFQSGRQSTGSLTVVNNNAISTAPATNSLQVVSNVGLSTAVISVPGFTLRHGVNWTTKDTSSNTAESIKVALASTGLLVSRAPGSSIVYATAPANGSLYNSSFMNSNHAGIAVAKPLFTGGVNNAVVSINGVQLRQGTNWTRGATAALSATSIASAINSNPLLNSLVTAQASGSVVTATSTINGTAARSSNFSLASSTAAISLSGAAMANGAPPSYALSGRITILDHGFSAGLPVLLDLGSAVIGGLSSGTTYYAVPVDADTVGLATSKDLALAGTFVVFTSSTSQLSANTATLAPLAISGTPSFKWQASNDALIWTDMAVSSVTMGSTGTPYATPPSSTLWSFGSVGTRYVRLKVVGPAAGGILLGVTVIGTN